jgi:hypothetical protein
MVIHQRFILKVAFFIILNVDVVLFLFDVIRFHVAILWLVYEVRNVDSIFSHHCHIVVGWVSQIRDFTANCAEISDRLCGIVEEDDLSLSEKH